MASHDLETIRHSTAHLMAQAITRLWPDLNVQLGIGPTIDTGFYYDIGMSHTLTEEDLPKIEEMIKKIIKEVLEIKRGILSKE
ncbi:MAG: threonine--tRNA ligase, partial [Bacteriovoracales bacterium]